MPTKRSGLQSLDPFLNLVRREVACTFETTQG
jgi:hypothetical protein